MTLSAFCRTYPRLYHMAEAAMWPSIRRHGLLSTSALLDLYEIPEPERTRIERTRRPDFIPIDHPKFGQALIRDQRPMSDDALRRVLTGGMTPAEWYALLNGKVFFWVDEERLNRLLNAYRRRDNCVLVLDTAKVMARCAARVMLSPINSGFTLRFPQPRGRETFLPWAEYPFEYWIKKRGNAIKAVAECAVNGGVPEVEECLIERRDVPAARERKAVSPKPSSSPSSNE